MSQLFLSLLQDPVIGGFIVNLASSMLWDGAKKSYSAVTSKFFSSSSDHDTALEAEFSNLDLTDQIKRHAQHLIAAVEQSVGVANTLDPFSCEIAVEQLTSTLAGGGSACQSLSRQVSESLSNRGILKSPTEQEVSRLAAIVLVAITQSKLLPLVQLRTTEIAVEGIARLEKRAETIDANVNEIRKGVAQAASHDANSEIDAARQRLNANEPDVAIHLLTELHRRRWDTLTPRERYRLLANLGLAREDKGEFTQAARLYMDAAQYQPQDEIARALNAVAFFLLEDRGKAYSLAQDVRNDHPNCSLAVAVCIRSAPAEISFVTLEQSVPPALREELDVLHALSTRAIDLGELAAAERLTRSALKIHPQSAQLQVQLANVIVKVESRAKQSNKPASAAKLNEAVTAISAGLARSRSPLDMARLRILRAEAFELLGRTDEAETDFRAATELDREDPDIVGRFAIFLAHHGRNDAAIESLKRTVDLRFNFSNRIILANLLSDRNHTGDRDFASALLQETLPLARNAAKEQRAAIAATLIRLLGNFKKHDDAVRLIDELEVGFLSDSTAKTIRAEALWLADRKEEARICAMEGIQSLTADSQEIDRMRVAEALGLVGEKREALIVWKTVLRPEQDSPFNHIALKLAREIGDDQYILSFCKQLRAAGVNDPFATELEVLTQEKYALFEDAIAVMQAYLVAPANENLARIFRVRLALLGLRLQRPELIETDAAKLPAVETGPVQVGAAVALILRHGQHPEQGVFHAYELVRRNFADAMAREAYVGIMGIEDNLRELFPEPAAVVPGCAVQYKADDTGEEKWVIIEDGANPSFEREEIAANHILATELRGKIVGDQFHLRRDSIQSRTATIRAIRSKYVYRKYEILDSWEERFPDRFFVRKYNSPTKEDGSPDISLILKVVDLREQEKEKLHSLYRDKNISVTTFAKITNAGVLASLSNLATESLPIRSCWGTTEEVERAEAALANDGILVLDPSALATMFFSGQYKHLEQLPYRYVVCESALAEYLELQLKFANPTQGFAGKVKGKFIFHDDDPDERQRQLQRVVNFLSKIRTLVTTKSGEQLAGIGSERREELVHLFGWPTAESIAEAAATGSVLWTDDIAVAEVSREEFGVQKRVWTQFVFKSTSARDVYDDITLFLLQWHYFFTRVEPELVVPAGDRAHWNANHPPLDSVLQWVGSPELKDQAAYLLSAKMLPLIWRHAPLVHQREAVTKFLAKEILKRPAGRRILAGIISELNELFGVDVLGCDECKRVLLVLLEGKSAGGLIIPGN